MPNPTKSELNAWILLLDGDGAMHFFVLIDDHLKLGLFELFLITSVCIHRSTGMSNQAAVLHSFTTIEDVNNILSFLQLEHVP